MMIFRRKRNSIKKSIGVILTVIIFIGLLSLDFKTVNAWTDLNAPFPWSSLQLNTKVKGELRYGDSIMYKLYIPVDCDVTIDAFLSPTVGEGLGGAHGIYCEEWAENRAHGGSMELKIYNSPDMSKAIHKIEQCEASKRLDYPGKLYFPAGEYFFVIEAFPTSGSYELSVNTYQITSGTIPTQTFPPYAIKTLEVVGGLPSTINTDTTLKFIATTDSSVTKVLFSDNYFFNRNDLETVASSNGVFQTTKNYTFNEGSHIIYCFPIDANGNVVYNNGLGIDEVGRSYGAALNVVKTTGGGFNGGFQGESISVGAKFRWSSTSGVIGYRVYRSESPSDEGISITDFYITSNEFVDVNVKPNRTYYYTVRGVIAEARPFDGIPEQLTSPSERITVNTPSTILGDDLQPPSPNAVKKFILMTLDDPYMTINGTKTEIDPGRGTTPILLNNRTMVPIRAIVEGMGGTIGWNEANREVTLNYQPNVVKMTLDKEQFTVNGTAKTADVPPTSINGRTMLPIRFAAESLGCAIDWLNSTKQVVIVYY